MTANPESEEEANIVVLGVTNEQLSSALENLVGELPQLEKSYAVELLRKMLKKMPLKDFEAEINGAYRHNLELYIAIKYLDENQMNLFLEKKEFSRRSFGKLIYQGLATGVGLYVLEAEAEKLKETYQEAYEKNHSILKTVGAVLNELKTLRPLPTIAGTGYFAKSAYLSFNGLYSASRGLKLRFIGSQEEFEKNMPFEIANEEQCKLFIQRTVYVHQSMA